MDTPPGSVGELIENLIGGAGVTMVAAAAGRLMWHTVAVRKKERRFWGRELLWEIPLAVGMAMIGEAVVSHFGFGNDVKAGVIAIVAYLGPRGVEALLARYQANGKI